MSDTAEARKVPLTVGAPCPNRCGGTLEGRERTISGTSFVEMNEEVRVDLYCPRCRRLVVVDK